MDSEMQQLCWNYCITSTRCLESNSGLSGKFDTWEKVIDKQSVPDHLVFFLVQLLIQLHPILTLTKAQLFHMS